MILTTCAACAAPLASNAPRCVRCQTRYCHTYFEALWLHHFFGHKRYREHLRTAVKGLIALIFLAVNVFGSWEHQTCEEIQDTLCRVLAHQLDWSLDDLELDAHERKVVDMLLEEPDYAKF